MADIGSFRRGHSMKASGVCTTLLMSSIWDFEPELVCEKSAFLSILKMSQKTFFMRPVW